MQPKAEGIFVPISDDGLGSTLINLRAVTCDLVGLSVEVGREVEKLLKGLASSDLINVDFDKLNDSHESWVYVNVTPSGNFRLFNGFSPFKGIITWPNSD